MAASTAAVSVSAQSPTSLYDSAEGLLTLDVWNGAPHDARTLVTASAGLQPAQARNDARDWAEHIIEPLLH
jgi:hypothetical protein